MHHPWQWIVACECMTGFDLCLSCGDCPAEGAGFHMVIWTRRTIIDSFNFLVFFLIYIF